MQALSPASSHILSLALYAPTAASSREHYYAQYASSRSGDAGSHPKLVLRLQTPTNASLSHADGKGLHRAVAGQPATFIVQAVDAEGIDQSLGGDLLMVDIVSPDGAIVNATVLDLGDGRYTVSYTPIVATAYSISMRLNGEEISSSPGKVHVLAGSPSPAHCVAAGPGLTEASAGTRDFFLITPRDSFGNTLPRLEPGDKFTVSLGHWQRGKVDLWRPVPVHDLLNGTFRAEYSVDVAGVYLIQVQMGHISIMGSPFQTVVLPANTEAQAPFAHGAGMTTAVVGVPASFTIVARDAFGNSRSMCGDNFNVTISGPSHGGGQSHLHGTVSEFVNGTYTVDYTVTTTGLYYVSVTLGERHIRGSPFRLTALPSTTHALHSVAFGPQLTQTTAGNSSEFYILAKDAYGNELHTAAAGNFSVTLRGPSEVRADVVDKFSGLYVASYVARLAGSYTTDVTYNGYPIFGSPYTTLVHAARAQAARCVAVCTDAEKCATHLGVAGELQRFSIRARDAFDNDCKTGGEMFVAKVLSRHGKAAHGALVEGAPGRDTEAGHGAVLDTNDGMYSVAYSVETAGAYTLHVKLRGEHIRGSPFHTTIMPGPTCANKATVLGMGKSIAISGELSEFRVLAADCYGNTQIYGGDSWTIRLTRPGLSNIYGSMADLKNGTYQGSYNATVRGQWTLHVKTNGVYIDGSPSSVLVLPGPTHAATSVAIGTGISRSHMGESSVFMIRTKDRFGNDRASGGDVVTATLTQVSTDQVVHANVTDTEDGSYTVRYALTVTSGAPYLLVVRINGEPVRGAPFLVDVLAGPTSCASSISTDLPRCIVGTISEAPIFAKDNMGNQRTTGGDVFTATLALVSKAHSQENIANETAQVGDNGDGTYRAMWVATRATKYQLYIEGECGPIKGSPYSVECLPAALSVAHSSLKGEGATDAVAGASASFEVVARDIFNNELSTSSYKWAAMLYSPAVSVEVSVRSRNGRDMFTYNATRSGVYELMVGAPNDGTGGGVNGSMQARGSPTQVTVRPGPLCGPRSVMYGPMHSDMDSDVWSAGAGLPIRLWIEPRDRFDNVREISLSPLPFTVTVCKADEPSHCKTLPAASLRAARGGSSACTVDFVLSETGDFLVSAAAKLPPDADGVSGPLLGSPYKLSILPGPTSTHQTTASGPGLSVDAQVGRLMWISITARDMFGNRRRVGGDRFELSLHGPNGTVLGASSMVDLGNGTYNGTYLATVAGNYSVHVLRRGGAGAWEIHASPYHVYVRSGPSSARVSRIAGRHTVMAGEEAVFALLSHDEFGNAQGIDEALNFEIKAVPADSSLPTHLAKIEQIANGASVVVTHFAAAGEYSLRGVLTVGDGEAMPDFPVHVEPGALSPSHSALIFPCHEMPDCAKTSLRLGYVGWPVRFALIPMDAYGNRRFDAGKGVVFVARIASSQRGRAAQVRCDGETALHGFGSNAVYCQARQASGALHRAIHTSGAK